MDKTRRIRKNALRYATGTLLGAVVGFVASQLSSAFGSECTLVCEPEIAVAYFGLVGLVLSLK